MNPASSASAPRPPTSPPRGGWLAAQGRLPLAFMGLALGWLVAGTGFLLARPDLLALPHVHPHVVAVTHAWLLGFFLTVACGAAYQLAPVALGTTLWSERYGWWHFGLQVIGVPGMVASFWRWDMAQVGHFGTLVTIGVALYAANVWITVLRANRPGVVSDSLLVSSLWLGLTVLMGLTFAANRFWHFIPLDPVPLLRVHAHAGLAGFFVTLLQGVTFQLVPMFTLGEVEDWRLATRGFWITQVGLLGLLPALLLRLAWVETIFGVLLLAGLLCSAVTLRRTLATRKKRALDPGVQAFLGGATVLLIAGIAGLILAWPGATADSGSGSGGLNATFYGLLVVFGGLLPCFTGMLGKIVPFLTWMRAYGPRVGREPTPVAGSLGIGWLERSGLVLQFLALVPLAAGTWTLDTRWLTAGAVTLAAGVGLFLLNQLGVLRHLWLAPRRSRQRANAAQPSGRNTTAPSVPPP